MAKQDAATDATIAVGVECRDLRKVYSNQPQPIVAVGQISFCVPAGQCCGVLGANGAGKTTLIDMLIGQCQPTSGSFSVLGSERRADYRNRIGVTLQQMVLPPKLTAIETLRLFAAFYPQPLEITSTLDLVGLTKQDRQQVQTLSGGQQQRLAVACALIGDPDVLFLDEPTTGVDPVSRRQIWDALQAGKKQRTVLLTTHSMEEATQLCDEVLILSSGNVIASGEPSELITRHLDSQRIRVGLEAALSADCQSLRDLPHAIDVDQSPTGIVIETTNAGETVAALVTWMESRSISINELEIQRGNLEDVFVKLSRGELSDD